MKTLLSVSILILTISCSQNISFKDVALNNRDSHQFTTKSSRVDSFEAPMIDFNQYVFSTISVSYELPDSPYNVPNATRDIEKDSMSLIIHGGITGFGEMNEERSLAFQKKYGVQIIYLGCLRSWNIESEDTHGYNETIFAHLEAIYGDIVHYDYKEIWMI